MILRRLGNKKALAHKIYSLFPKHTTYAEPFFGAGGMFFYKPRAKYNLLNDLDNDVFNLWQVVQTRPDDLFAAMETMVVHESLFQYWRKNQETDPILQAVRFLMLSNFGLLGKTETFKVENGSINTKKYILQGINQANSLLTDCLFTNKDAIAFLKSIPQKEQNSSLFIYCDPPYLKTTDNYQEHGWDAESLSDLMLYLKSMNEVNFAISEFENDTVLQLAKEYGLYVTRIGERQSLKNRSTEILTTNYPVASQKSMF